MRNKKLLALLLVLTLVFAVSGCGSKKVDKKDSTVETTEEREILDDNSSTKEDDSDKTDVSETIEDESNNIEDNGSSLDKNESEPSKENETNKNETTGNNNTTTKPSNGSTGNSGSTNNSGNTGNTSSNNTGTTTQPSTPVHEHNWTEVTEDEIHYYAWRTLCGKCGLDMTDMSDEELTIHVTFECQSRYSTKYIEVDFVTENVVKTPVVTGYKCSCGETKEK